MRGFKLIILLSVLVFLVTACIPKNVYMSQEDFEVPSETNASRANRVCYVENEQRICLDEQGNKVIMGGGATEEVVEETPEEDDFKEQFEKLKEMIEEGKAEEASGVKVTGEIVTDTSVVEEPVIEPVPIIEEVELVEETRKSDISVYEGDLVSLNLHSTDPDGDKLLYTFSDPLNEDGKWQTEKGDAGFYDITVTASDGKLESKKVIVVEVKSRNKPPVITGVEDLTVNEGDLIKLEPKASDPEGDAVEISYSGFMQGSSYTTTDKDAGTHKVKVTATDSYGSSATKEITITVENVNKAPVLDKINDIIVKEGDLVKVTPIATDADGEQLTFEYGKPLNENGEWQTAEGDAGTYHATVTVSDGYDTIKVTVKITVTTLNTPPTIEAIADFAVNEGETVIFNPKVSDLEGSEVTVTYSGWMTTASYKTAYDDAGEHTVTITASDGELSSSIDVKVTVNEVNRAPEFCIVGIDC